MIIRSVFNRPNVSGYASISLTQPLGELIDGFAKGKYRDYRELTERR